MKHEWQKAYICDVIRTQSERRSSRLENISVYVMLDGLMAMEMQILTTRCANQDILQKANDYLP